MDEPEKERYEQTALAETLASYNMEDGLKLHIKPKDGTKLPWIVGWMIVKQVAEDQIYKYANEHKDKFSVELHELASKEGKADKPAFPDLKVD